MHAHTGVLRERVLRAADACFGHRLMMDVVAPGGTNADLTSSGVALIREVVANIRGAFPALVELYDNTTSLQDRTVGTGVSSRGIGPPIWLRRVCRARVRTILRTHAAISPMRPMISSSSRRPFSLRGMLTQESRIRIREVEQSLPTYRPDPGPHASGAIRPEVAGAGELREGLALVEGFRGDILVWVRLREGGVERCHLRDPSWFQWPLLEAAIEGKSWRIFQSATNPSIALIPGTTSRSGPCAELCLKSVTRPPLTEPVPAPDRS